MKTITRLALTAAVLVASHSALAAEANTAYIGANVGQSNYNASSNDCTQSLQNAGLNVLCTVDSNDVGFKLYAGYNILPMLAVEGGYVNFGKAKIKISNGGTANGEQKSDGINLDLVFNAPIETSPLTLSARIGAYSLHTDSSLTGPGGSLSDSSNTTGLHFGIGAGFALSKQAAIRLEAERYQDVGDDNHNAFKSDVDLISVGFVYTFAQ